MRLWVAMLVVLLGGCSDSAPNTIDAHDSAADGRDARLVDAPVDRDAASERAGDVGRDAVELGSDAAPDADADASAQDGAIDADSGGDSAADASADATADSADAAADSTIDADATLDSTVDADATIDTSVDAPSPDATFDAGVPPCPTATLYSGYNAKLVYNGTRFISMYRSPTSPQLIYVARLDSTIKLDGNPTSLLVQDSTTSASAASIVAGAAGQTAVVWREIGAGYLLQRIDPSGAKVGSNISVSANSSVPAVAYDSSRDQYAVFDRQAATIVNAQSGAIARTLTLSPTLSGIVAPAYNSTADRYAVVWVNSQRTVINLATVDPTGVAVTATTAIYTAPANKEVYTNSGNQPLSVAYNATNNEYGVVFRLQSTPATSVYAGELLFLQVSATPAALGQATVAPQGEYGLYEPVIVYSGTRYGVTFVARTGSNPGATVVELDRTGAVVGGPLVLSCSSGGTKIYPWLARGATRWGVLWATGSTVYGSYWLR